MSLFSANIRVYKGASVNMSVRYYEEKSRIKRKRRKVGRLKGGGYFIWLFLALILSVVRIAMDLS